MLVWLKFQSDEQQHVIGKLFLREYYADWLLFRVCFVCREPDHRPFKVVSEEQRRLIFVKSGVFVPPGNRCCNTHLYNGHLSFEALQKIKPNITDVLRLDSNAVSVLLDDCCKTIQGMKTFDFDDPASLDNNAYYNITGLEKGRSLQFFLIMVGFSRWFQWFTDKNAIYTQFSSAVYSCCSCGLPSKDATWFEQHSACVNVPFREQTDCLENYPCCCNSVEERLRSSLSRFPSHWS